MSQANPQLRILCFGGGAIGTYIGGSLAASGQQVVWLDRPTVVPALHENGIQINVKGQKTVVEHPQVVATIEEALANGPFDLALLAVKSYDTKDLAESLRPYLATLPPILSFQNGVENEAMLASVLGSDKVIAGTVTTAIGRREMGSIVVEKLRGLGVAGDHPLSAIIVSVLNQAGLRAQSFPDALSMKWSKMVTNLLSNATSAILDMPPGAVFSHPGLYQIEVAQIREAVQVMKALRLAVVDLPGTPVRLLVKVMTGLPAALSRPLVIQSVGKGRGNKMPSFHIDLHQGRGKSEVEYLNGAVVRFGEQAHVPTPTNRFLNDLLMDLTNQTLPLNAYAGRPEQLIAEWKNAITSRSHV